MRRIIPNGLEHSRVTMVHKHLIKCLKTAIREILKTPKTKK